MEKRRFRRKKSKIFNIFVGVAFLCVVILIANVFSIILCGGNFNILNKSEVKVSAEDYYFVTFGEFSNIEEAENQMSLIQQLGGAGYVIKENEKYFLAVSSYESKSKAQEVVEKNKDKNIELNVIKFSVSARNIKLAKTLSDTTKLENCFYAYKKVYSSLKDISTLLDSGEITATAGATKIFKINSYLENLKKNLEENKSALSCEQYDGISTELNFILTKVNDLVLYTKKADLMHQIKYAYFDVIYYLATWIDKI